MPDRNSRACPATEEVCPHHEDVLMGADAIAEFIYGDPKQRRKVYHLAEPPKNKKRDANERRLPTFKLGATLCMRKSTYLEWIAAQERKAAGQ